MAISLDPRFNGRRAGRVQMTAHVTTSNNNATEWKPYPPVSNQVCLMPRGTRVSNYLTSRQTRFSDYLMSLFREPKIMRGFPSWFNAIVASWKQPPTPTPFPAKAYMEGSNFPHIVPFGTGLTAQQDLELRRNAEKAAEQKVMRLLSKKYGISLRGKRVKINVMTSSDKPPLLMREVRGNNEVYVYSYTYYLPWLSAKCVDCKKVGNKRPYILNENLPDGIARLFFNP